jgi:hypothetical protein
LVVLAASSAAFALRSAAFHCNPVNPAAAIDARRAKEDNMSDHFSRSSLNFHTAGSFGSLYFQLIYSTIQVAVIHCVPRQEIIVPICDMKFSPADAQPEKQKAQPSGRALS